MAIRPTVYWRQCVADEAEQIASGQLGSDCAGMADLFPEPILTGTDTVLTAFETDLAALSSRPISRCSTSSSGSWSR